MFSKFNFLTIAATGLFVWALSPTLAQAESSAASGDHNPVILVNWADDTPASGSYYNLDVKSFQLIKKLRAKKSPVRQALATSSTREPWRLYITTFAEPIANSEQYIFAERQEDGCVPTGYLKLPPAYAETMVCEVISPTAAPVTAYSVSNMLLN